MKVISSDGARPLHLQFSDDASKKSTSNWDVTGEWALFVDVVHGFGIFWGFDAETNRFDVSFGGIFVELVLDKSNSCLFLETS